MYACHVKCNCRFLHLATTHLGIYTYQPILAGKRAGFSIKTNNLFTSIHLLQNK